MRSLRFAAVALLLVLLLGGAGAVLAIDSAQQGTIAHGIRIGGIGVGGLRAAEASRRLRAVLAPRLRRPVVLRLGAERFVLSPQAARLRLETGPSVQEALAAGQQENMLGRALRVLTGAELHRSFQPRLSFSEPAVARMIARVRRTLDRPARNAAIAFDGGSIQPLRSRPGMVVRSGELRRRIVAALVRGGGGPAVAIPVERNAPAVSTASLAARYPTLITIARDAFTLRLWQHLRLVRSYRIAVGMAGLQTPAGLYHVQEKQVDPSWHVPNSSWAGALAGQTIPPGPGDPIKARWMGIYNGAGIHGTDELGSLGSAASHGCIRMAIPDVIELYDRTPLGTPVYIA